MGTATIRPNRPRLEDNPEFVAFAIGVAEDVAGGKPVKALAAEIGASPATTYRYLTAGRMFLLGRRLAGGDNPSTTPGGNSRGR